MRHVGFEWMHRLAPEPGGLAGHCFVGNVTLLAERGTPDCQNTKPSAESADASTPD